MCVQRLWQQYGPQAQQSQCFCRLFGFHADHAIFFTATIYSALSAASTFCSSSSVIIPPENFATVVNDMDFAIASCGCVENPAGAVRVRHLLAHSRANLGRWIRLNSSVGLLVALLAALLRVLARLALRRIALRRRDTDRPTVSRVQIARRICLTTRRRLRPYPPDQTTHFAARPCVAVIRSRRDRARG